MTRILLFVLLLALAGCRKEGLIRHHNNLAGKWKRVEVYINPGDGGSWQQDQSSPVQTISFTAGGKMASNSTFYSNFTGFQITGDNTIEFLPPLNGQSRAVYFSFNSETELTLTYACIEGCGDRFVRME